MRGYNSEIHPTRQSGLKEPAFPQFQNVTLRESVITPVAGDGTHGTPTFAEESLGTYVVSQPFAIAGTTGFQAYVAASGGTVQFRDANGTTSPIALPTPATAQVHGTNGLGYTLGSNGIPWGETRVYSLSYMMGTDTHFGLSPVVEVTNDAYKVGIYGTNATGAAPIYGETFTVGTAGTATVLGVTSRSAWGTDVVVLLYTPPGTFASGDVATFASGGVATFDSGEATAAFVLPSIDSGTSLPSGADRLALFGLANSGIYYLLGRSGTSATVLSDTSYFGELLDSDRQPLQPYAGPLDANGYPEPLVVPGTCQTLVLHKGCLFVAEGNLLKWSEAAISGVEYRWFREGFGIDCGGTIWALVSRGELLEVYTDKGVRLVVGSAPYFEVRDSQMHEIAISRWSVVGTDIGTFYHAADGLRLARPTSIATMESKLLSKGWNGPWFDGLVDPPDTVGGASKGVYYIVDSDGACLAYDWEKEEWRTRSFDSRPLGFSWSETELHLVAKVGSEYVAVESEADTAVDWLVQYPSRPGSKNRPIQSKIWLNNVGPMSVKVYVDDDLVRTIPVAYSARGRLRMPMARGSGWYLTIDGTGTRETNKILGVEDE